MNNTPTAIVQATVVAACIVLAAPPARSQAHTETSGNYVLRASTVSAANLPRAMLDRYGIRGAPNTAIVNVTLQRAVDGLLRNQPARVDVRARNLLGVETPVEMREVVADGLVSYMGTYRFLPTEVLDFRVTARPAGAQQTLTLEFRDRLGRQ